MMKLLLALALLQVSAAKSTHGHLPSAFTLSNEGSTPYFSSAAPKHILRERSVHERRRDVKKGVRAASSTKHEVVFAVKQNLDELKSLVDDISNPFSANYGQHLKRADVTAMTGVPESYQHVVTFLKLHGVEVVKSSKFNEYITASASVSKWEELFATEFYQFEVESVGPVVRAEHYSLPDVLHDHVASVLNTVQFPVSRVQPNRDISDRRYKLFPGTPDTLEKGYVTPNLLYGTYDIRSTAGSALASQAVYESLDDAMSPSDLALFQETFGLPSDTVTATNGNSDDNACRSHAGCFESNLDVQYITAVASGVPTYYMYDDSHEFMIAFLSSVAEMEDPPKVISVSYSDQEFYFSSSYMDTFNNEAMKLAAMGVTIVVASGDDGVSGVVSRIEAKYCGYNPLFPASSPYVTAVGATMGPEQGNDEVACQVDLGGEVTSGGGFSNLVNTPVWQEDAVAEYVSNAAADKTTGVAGFNAAGRGYPDVSLLGANYAVAAAGGFYSISGTSASAPTFAGMVSLVNSKRLEAGKSSLGWLNPSLYAHADSFVNDITTGSNFCGAGLVCCGQGFTATKGWDPVTGLGSVNYTAFEATFFALGDHPSIPSVRPTRSPAASTIYSGVPSPRPSRAPTAVPSSANGWLYVNYYSETGCSGDISRVEGYRTNECVPAWTTEGDAFYIKYRCESEYGYVAGYSDSECQYPVISIPMGLNTCSSPDSYYYDGEVDYSLSVGCSTTSVKPLDTSVSYVVLRSFTTTDGCNAADEYKFEAFQNKNCFSRPFWDTSFKYRYPNIYVYGNSSTCQDGGLSQMFSETLTTGCTVETVTGDYNIGLIGSYYDDGSVVYGSEKTQFIASTTTKPPTHKPTFAPTHKPDYYLMTVEQTISGVNAADFNTNWDVYAPVFSATVAECMDGIDADHVAIVSVSDVAASSRLRRGLSVDAVVMDYSVSYDISALGYAGDAEGAYNSLIGQLENAIDVVHVIGGTHFNSFLANNIVVYNVSGLDAVSGGSIGSSSYEQDIDDDPPVLVNHKKRHTRYFIIGVIAGGGGFIVLSWLVIYGLSVWYKKDDSVAAGGGAGASGAAGRGDGFEAVNTKEIELAAK